MPPQPRIPSQPSSPSYSNSSNSPTRTTAPPPVRRNLFSAHLSRRPASSTSGSQSQSQQHSQPSLPPPQRTPSGSPFASPPHLPPNPPQLHPSFNTTYDPTISPTHPLSPGTAQIYFPSGGIIAVHPGTGRPLLPTLPHLPSKLRLSSQSDEEDDEDEEGHEDHPSSRANPSIPHHDPSNHDPFSTSSATNTQHPIYYNPAADEAESDAYHHAQSLSHINDMMSRYRSRQSTLLHSTSSASSASHHAAKVSRQHPPMRSRSNKENEGDEDIEAEEEREELMAMLMAKLRREVVRAEEEGWMFGESGVGVGAEEGGASGVGQTVVGGGVGLAGFEEPP